MLFIEQRQGGLDFGMAYRQALEYELFEGMMDALGMPRQIMQYVAHQSEIRHVALAGTGELPIENAEKAVVVPMIVLQLLEKGNGHDHLLT